MENEFLKAHRLTATLRAVAHPTRRSILRSLSKGEAVVSFLALVTHITPPMLSKHLKVLERAGLIHREVQGHYRFISLRMAPLLEIIDWIETLRASVDARDHRKHPKRRQLS